MLNEFLKYRYRVHDVLSLLNDIYIYWIDIQFGFVVEGYHRGSQISTRWSNWKANQ